MISIESRPTFRDLQGRFIKANTQLLSDKRDMMRGLGRSLVRYMRAEAPKGRGEFQKTLRFRSFQTGNTVGFTTSMAKPLGDWIIGGTRPHKIVARNANALRFNWARGPQGAGVYFFKSVNHPGTKPNPFHLRALQRWKPEAKSELLRISTRWKETVERA